MSSLSFPGLGISEFSLNSTAFSIFGRDIAWYGIIITLGIIAGYLYTQFRGNYEGIKTEDIMDYTIITVISAILGARLYYVLTNLDRYDTFMEAIAIWEGGLAIYGGIIAGAIAVFCVSKFKRISFFKMADAVTPGVMLGQIIGRWGNFFNIEAFGGPTTLPWRMCSPVIASDFSKKGLVDDTGFLQVLEGTLGAHPTFIYESVWNIIGFILINIFYKKKKYNGQIALMYFTWYGLGRMFIEGLRTDSLYVGPFRISQIVGFATFLLGAVTLLVLQIKKFSNLTKKEATESFE